MKKRKQIEPTFILDCSYIYYYQLKHNVTNELDSSLRYPLYSRLGYRLLTHLERTIK